jgi:hypothetical protein
MPVTLNATQQQQRAAALNARPLRQAAPVAVAPPSQQLMVFTLAFLMILSWLSLTSVSQSEPSLIDDNAVSLTYALVVVALLKLFADLVEG